MTALRTKLKLVLCMLLFVACNLQAQIIDVPVLKSRVTDLTQTLSHDQRKQLEAKIAAFEQVKGSQIAVLMLPTTQPEDIAQFSIRVTDAWQLGRAKPDDGVLIVVAKNDRKMRIEVGYGLEGAIPDLTAKRIINEVMAPSFKQDDYYTGINNALDQLMRLIAGEQLPAPAASASPADIEASLPLLLFAALIAAGVLRAIFGSFFGGILSGGIISVLAWLVGVGLSAAILFGLVAFFMTLIGPSGLAQLAMLSSGGRGGGNPFSGGGGGFGGGGASGNW
jgi:uncharacterized protein